MTVRVIRTGPTVSLVMKRVGDGVKRTMPKTLLRAAQHAAGEIAAEAYSTFSHPTGQLPRSFEGRFVGEFGGGWTAAAESDLAYARIQDEGGIILPRTRKNLAVPIRSANLPVGKWPRHFPTSGASALHYIARKGKRALLAQIVGKGDKKKIKPIFVLMPFVRLSWDDPKRGYVGRGGDAAMPGIEQILAEAMDAAGGDGVT